jgi:hypothetical protein
MVAILDKFKITELDIEALVDSQLDWEREKAIRREIEINPELNKYYKEMLQQKKLIIDWWHSLFRKENGH